MPRKAKHNYDINKIAKEYNEMELIGETPSLRKVYRKLGLPETQAHAWVTRNFYRFVKFEDKKNKEKVKKN